MRNIIFGGVPNYADEALLSAGSQAPLLPVTNLKDRQIVKYWRSTETSQSATYIEAVFPSVRNIGIVALINHNFSPATTRRIRLARNSSYSPSVYDSGYVEVWPTIEEFGILPWGVFQWGGILPREVASGMVLHDIQILPAPVAANYLRIDINDAGNPAGYVQAGRLVAGPTYEPSVNLEYGWNIGYEDNSEYSKSRGGQTWIDTRPKYRVLNLTLSELTEEETFSNIFYHMYRNKGVTGDLLVIPQPENLQQMHHQAIYGRLRRLNPVQNPYFQSWGTTFEIEELI